MIVTRINPLDKKRYEIYLDNKLAFVLYKSELRSFDLQENGEMTQSDYDEIVDNILPKRALLRCGHLLEKRDYTKKQLEDKLKLSHYPESSIEYAINKVIGYGFINDVNYAKRYIECKLDKISKQSIKRKLWEKGIDKADIDRAFELVEEDGVVQNEDELIQKILTKRHYFDSDLNSIDNKERNKQYNYLRSKGFSNDAIIRNLKLNE